MSVAGLGGAVLRDGSRDGSVDGLRGLAIVTMLSANLGPCCLVEPHPLYVRLYGSFAAPLFVTLSGMMAWRSLVGGAPSGAEASGSPRAPRLHSLRDLGLRSLVLFTFASLLDVAIWRCFPGITVDVLYLLAVLPLVLHALRRTSTSARGALALAVVGLAEILRQVLGYPAQPFNLDLATDPLAGYLVHADRIAIRWLVQGDFALLPWLGFGLFGSVLADLRYGREDTFPSRRVVRGAPVALVVFAGLWAVAPGPAYVRSGYSELFYPAVAGYVLFSAALVVALFAAADRFPRLLAPLGGLGRSSLLVYVSHELLIARMPFLSPRPLLGFLAVYLGLVAFYLTLVPLVLDRLRPRARAWPLPLRMLFG